MSGSCQVWACFGMGGGGFCALVVVLLVGGGGGGWGGGGDDVLCFKIRHGEALDMM